MQKQTQTQQPLRNVFVLNRKNAERTRKIWWVGKDCSQWQRHLNQCTWELQTLFYTWLSFFTCHHVAHGVTATAVPTDHLCNTTDLSGFSVSSLTWRVLIQPFGQAKSNKKRSDDTSNPPVDRKAIQATTIKMHAPNHGHNLPKPPDLLRAACWVLFRLYSNISITNISNNDFPVLLLIYHYHFDLFVSIRVVFFKRTIII